MTDYAYGTFKRENPEWDQDFFTVEEIYADTMGKWETSKEKKLLSDIMELKENGDMENYNLQAKKLISQLKSDYKRQIQN
jgi:hypothetical protein